MAGRTDAGVHASGQVVSLSLEKDTISAHRLQEGLNFYLRPYRIVVLEAAAVAPTFNARFSALKRHYVYKILNRHAPSALLADTYWHIKKPLDHALMRQALARLVGHLISAVFAPAAPEPAAPCAPLTRRR